MQENVAFQGNKPSNQSTTMAKRNREADSSQAAQAELKGPVGLDDLIQEGARQIIQQAIEAELKTLLERALSSSVLEAIRIGNEKESF